MITSTNNERIKAARKLHHKSQRDASGLLLVEGVRLIEDAWRSGVQPVQLFYTPAARQQNARVAALVAQAEAAAVLCLPATAEVVATLAATVTPQGVVAVMPLPNLPLPAQPTLTLLLDQVREPGNAGALLRSAEAAGVDGVIFTPGTVDPFNDKVVRAGMGAHFRLPLHVCPDWASVPGALPAGQPLYLATVDGQLPYDQVAWRAPSVLVIGGEAAGASAALLALATPITIPMRGAVESLNAAVAGSVILFEAARQRRDATAR